MSTPNELWDDPRITAYVMNELSPSETTQFEAEMQQQPLLANAVDEARRVTEKLTGFYAEMPTSTLDANRREQIRGAATTPLASADTDANYTGWRIATWAIAASILMLAVALPLWQMSKHRVASNSVSDRGSFEHRETDGSQRDLIKPNASTEVDTAPLANSTRDAPADRGVKQTPAPRSDTDELTESLEASPAMKSMRSRSLSSPPPSPPAPFSPAPGRGAIGKKDQAKDTTASNTPFSANGPEMESMMMGSDASMMSGMDSMGMGGGMMGMDASMDGVATPHAPYQRGVETEPAARKKMPMTDQGTGPGLPGDKFSPLDDNEFRRVSEHPLSTFSIDVDTASYAKVRSYLQSNQLPRPDAVRIEEMINYFEYDYSGPSAIDGEPSDPFSAAMTAAICPWAPEHRLVRVGLQAKQLTEKERPQCNLVFLIDTSGSMSSRNKLPMVIEGLKILVDELRDNDRVAIVVYAGSAGLVLDSTPVEDQERILRALTQLRSGGSTNGGAGLQLAYDTAREHFLENGVNRVILCSDGDFNVGMTGTDALVREARTQAKSGVDLTVLGFGMGNHNDAMMEKISNDAEGNYAFVDTIAEARKVLADQLTGTLVTVAKDVKIQIEFNPAVVSAYRLIGYENRLLAKEDFNDDTKDAGEIGAGHQVTALYEVVPVGVDAGAVAPPVDPLKYQSAENAKPEPGQATDSGDQDDMRSSSAEMLTLKLRYKQPQGTTSKLMTRVLDSSRTPFDQMDSDFRFAASVAAFGMLLRNSPFAGTWTYDNVERVAEISVGSDTHGLRSEFVDLVKTAQALTVKE